jgi:hypothetical protein
MMERLTRRNEGMAAEYQRFSAALVSLAETSQETYAVDTNDVPLLNEGLNSTARHLDQSKQLLEDEARGWEEGVLEDFKRQRDTLVSVRDMFDRRDKYAKDNIPALEKRIMNNETKLQNIRNKLADQVKPGEAEKVEDAIVKVSLLMGLAYLEEKANAVLNRTKILLFSSMLGACSLKNAFAMSCYFSRRASISSADCIKSGVKSASNTQSYRQTIGVH